MQFPDTDSESILNSLRRIVSALRAGAHAVEKELGMSGAQLFALQKLAEEPGQSINALAWKTATHQSSVSAVISRLVKAGLVSRKSCPADARQVELSVTAAGHRKLRNAPSLPQEKLLQCLKAMSQSQRKQLEARLGELVALMGLEGTPAHMLFED